MSIYIYCCFYWWDNGLIYLNAYLYVLPWLTVCFAHNFILSNLLKNMFLAYVESCGILFCVYILSNCVLVLLALWLFILDIDNRCLVVFCCELFLESRDFSLKSSECRIDLILLVCLYFSLISTLCGSITLLYTWLL